MTRGRYPSGLATSNAHTDIHTCIWRAQYSYINKSQSNVSPVLGYCCVCRLCLPFCLDVHIFVLLYPVLFSFDADLLLMRQAATTLLHSGQNGRTVAPTFHFKTLQLHRYFHIYFALIYIYIFYISYLNIYYIYVIFIYYFYILFYSNCLFVFIIPFSSIASDIFKYQPIVIRYIDHFDHCTLSLSLSCSLPRPFADPLLQITRFLRTRLQRHLCGIQSTEIAHTHRCLGWQHSQHFVNCCCQIL